MSSGQKGVMLCERPAPSQMDSGPAPKPFLPSSVPSGLEPLGLVPTQKTYPPSLAPKPPNITIKSIATVRGIEEENRLLALLEEERKMAATAKAEHVSSFGAQLRTAILSGDDVNFWKAAKHAEKVKQSVEVSQARAATGVGNTKAADAGNGTRDDGDANAASMTSFVDDLLKEAALVLESPARVDGTKDASTSGGDGGGGGGGAAAAAGGAAAVAAPVSTPGGAAVGNRKGKGSQKPAWALTEEEVSKLDDAEEEDLLKFADDLDFDAFMAALDDPELQESVRASSGEGGKGPVPGGEKAWRRNLVKAMNHVAMKQVAAAARRTERERADDDSASVALGSEGGATALTRATATSKVKSEAGAAKRAALSDAKGDSAGDGWDSSTRASEDVGRMERTKAGTSEAFEFLRENPELRAVHSPASVRAMITKTDGTAVPGKTVS